MKKLLGFPFLLLLFCSIALCQQSQTGRARSNENKEEISAAVKAYYEAWNSGDLEKAGQLYAKDADLIFYDIAPLQYHGWAEYKVGVQKLLANYSSVKLIPNADLKIGRQGRMAWTTLTFHLAGTLKNGTKSDIEGRHTAIWEKRKGEWLLVHEHVSAPLPQQ